MKIRVLAEDLNGVFVFLCVGMMCACTTAEIDLCKQYRNDPCGNPCTVSSDYEYSEATIVKIIDCTHIEIEVHNRRTQEMEDGRDSASGSLIIPIRLQVKLAGIVPIEGENEETPRCISELKKLPEGTFVGVWDMSMSKFEEIERTHQELPVRLYLKTGTEINMTLLKRGLVAVADPEQVAGIDWWTECDFRRAEEKARKAKRGLWAETDK